MRSSRTVSATLVLWLVAAPETIEPLVARFSYSDEDPYAIRIAFQAVRGQEVEWVFARDLLSVGVEAEVGLGDVRVWPSNGPGLGTPGHVVNIELSASSGRAHFEASVKEISNFLRRVYTVVPAGEESEYIDVEPELNELLRGPHKR